MLYEDAGVENDKHKYKKIERILIHTQKIFSVKILVTSV